MDGLVFGGQVIAMKPLIKNSSFSERSYRAIACLHRGDCAARIVDNATLPAMT